MSVTSVAIQFTLIDLLSRGVDAAKHRLQSLAKANKDVQQSFDRMATSAKYAAIAGVATAAIGRSLRPAVALAGGLQREMLGARAELAGSVKDARELERQLKALKGNAFEVQAWTPYAQGQIVELEKQLLKAGAKVNAVIGPQGAAAASAALGVYENLNPEEMGQKLIGIATPFKLQASEFMALADEIARASSASVVGAAEIAETAKYAAPAMAQLGKSTHEMLVLSAMLAQRGIEASMAGTGLRQFFNSAAKHKVFQNETGGMKSLAEVTALLKKELGGLGEAQQLAALTKLFDVRGAVVALALMDEGAATYGEIEAAMAQSLSLQEKINIKMQGFDAQLESLKGTGKSVIGDLFQSALTPLTAVIKGTNEFLALLGRASQAHAGLGQAVSATSLATLGIGGLATAGLAGGALWYGRKMLKGVGGFKKLLGGAGSVGAGVAAGKAVEAATGVRPVFVTNWPAGGFAGGGIALSPGGDSAKLAGLTKTSISLAAALTPLIPVALAATAAGLSKMAGEAHAGWEAKGTSTDDLLAMRNRKMVMGGGDSIIDDELMRRNIGQAFQQDFQMSNEIAIELSVDAQGRVMSNTSDPNTNVTLQPLKRGEF